MLGLRSRSSEERSADGIRALGPRDLTVLTGLTARRPEVNVFVDHRAQATRLEPRWLGGEVWGRFADGELVAACHVGSTVVPVEADAESAALFARRLLEGTRTVASLVGEKSQVRAMWDVLGPVWHEPREFRWEQPYLLLDREPAVEPDPAVRRTFRSDADVLYPACVAMYTEELGRSPEADGGAQQYRNRVLQLISRGWSFARIEDGRVLFKAEVACVGAGAAQVQGVWVDPALRGRGLATAGLAAVARIVRESIAPDVVLYVNEWNAPARIAYDRIGFREIARFSTLLF